MLKTCIYCDVTFDAIRSTKKFCSDGCKYDYHALTKKIAHDGDGGIEMLRRLAGKAKKYPEKRTDVIQQVKKIESVASRLLVKLQT
jgi:protein-arginine kinase activator protein McsA